MISPSDEQRHAPGADPLWEESWSFNFAARDGSLGGYVRLAVVPREGAAWFWAAVTGPRRSLVALRDHDVAPPRGRALEARASGLWVDVVCETPLEHWSVGLEAFGVAFDDPVEAWGAERGHPTALGLDLEWEGAGPVGRVPATQAGSSVQATQAGSSVQATPADGHYGQACTVHGDVLVGRERIAFEGTGWRAHAWGPLDWWSDPWSCAAGTFDDGSTFSGTAEHVVLGRDGLPVSAVAGDVVVAAVAHAPVLVPGPPGGGPASRLSRALCRYTGAGREGYGWAEWLLPPARPGGSPPATG